MKRVLFALLICTAPAAADAIADGKQVYDTHCTACHGGEGRAGERAPAIVFTGATGPLRGERSDAQVLAVVRDGIPGTGMPAWGARLTADQIASLGAYIHALRGTALDNPAPGDAVHGEQMFWGKADCGSCHRIGLRGGVIGPDLGNIAAIRKTAQIRDALTQADHHVFGDGGVHLPAIPPMESDPVTIVTKDGKTLEGVMRNQDAWSVQVMGLESKLHSFSRADLQSITIKPGSVMPSDYDKRLSKAEFDDLMAFLTRQGKHPDMNGGGE
jgi:putative heme-binding domain-containing protein